MAAERIVETRQVLVVEDEMLIVLMIEDTLHDLGYQVIGPAADLETALQLAKSAPMDAAIVDINIRGGNSYGVADVLAGRGIPFVFCSGYHDWAVEERHRERPRLMKPYSPRELENRMLQLLGAPAD